MKPVVLLLSTYPFVLPRHGGQIRLANIAKAYQEKGWSLVSLAVCSPDSYPKKSLGINDLTIPDELKWKKFNGRILPLIDDILIGIYAASDDGFHKIVKRLPSHIDVIHVEQPWLWGLANRIREHKLYRNVKLIYGSQNIEAPLKREILANYIDENVDDVLEEIILLEQGAAREADLCFAVTEADRQVLLQLGSQNVLLARNGIEPWKASPDTLDKWRRKLPSAPWILYVASAHPPNFTGFMDVVGESLGCIPPDSRLVVAGSVSEHIYRIFEKSRWHTLNLSRLQVLNVLSPSDLAAVKTLAHAFILPLPYGGGSNIKTAEALYSGAYVIGTTAAFRGYEDFMRLPEIFVTNSPADYQRIIPAVLQRPLLVSENSTELRISLRWEHCINNIPESARNLLQ